MDSLERLLVESGALLRGHFVLSSGRHSDVYLEKFRILERPDVLTVLCTAIADWARPLGPSVVAGPTTGGIIIAFEVARQLGVSAVYVESEDGVKRLRRGARIEEGANVLVVDDVLTTGLSVVETLDVVKAGGGTPIGAAVLVDRSEADLGLNLPLFSAHRVEAKSYAENNVPGWLEAIPATKPGTRR
ncbi:MAG: orotate phosphoribosyltransferase [Fimbriimonadaceae bacterium]